MWSASKKDTDVLSKTTSTLGPSSLFLGCPYLNSCWYSHQSHQPVDNVGCRRLKYKPITSMGMQEQLKEEWSKLKFHLVNWKSCIPDIVQTGMVMTVVEWCISICLHWRVRWTLSCFAALIWVPAKWIHKGVCDVTKSELLVGLLKRTINSPQFGTPEAFLQKRRKAQFHNSSKLKEAGGVCRIWKKWCLDW